MSVAWVLYNLLFDLRFEMEDTKNLNLVPRTSSARKLTYSSEDIKREDTGYIATIRTGKLLPPEGQASFFSIDSENEITIACNPRIC